MKSNKEPITILMAEDDPEDQMLVREALEESHLDNVLHCVGNGEELIRYLHNKGKYSDKKKYPLPGIILLDLNMPKKDGKETLKEIKSDPKLRSIPVIVLTTSKMDEDILKTYDLGVSSFITKPVSFDGLVNVMKGISKYWFGIVKLPQNIQLKHEGSD